MSIRHLDRLLQPNSVVVRAAASDADAPHFELTLPGRPEATISAAAAAAAKKPMLAEKGDVGSAHPDVASQSVFT